jgi:hypothetical protein
MARPVSELQPISQRETVTVPAVIPLDAVNLLSPRSWMTRARMPAAALLFHLNRLGNSGVTGLGVAMVSAIFVATAIVPQYRQLGELRRELSMMQQLPVADATPQQRMSQFVQNLPARSELPKVAGQIFTIAVAAKVSLDKGRYELAPLKSSHLARYRMSFPIKGTYTSIRQFLDATLTALPAVSIEGLRIERKTVSDTFVEADVRLTVFVRSES